MPLTRSPFQSPTSPLASAVTAGRGVVPILLTVEGEPLLSVESAAIQTVPGA